MEEIAVGQVIEMLVEVYNADGWGWKNSLRRDDTGGGACELIYVESIKIIPD